MYNELNPTRRNCSKLFYLSIPYVQRHTDRRTSGARAGHGHQRTVQERTDSKGLKTAADIWVTFPVPLILGWPKLFTDGQIFIICKWIINCHFLSFEALFNTPGSSLKIPLCHPYLYLIRCMVLIWGFSFWGRVSQKFLREFFREFRWSFHCLTWVFYCCFAFISMSYYCKLLSRILSWGVIIGSP